MIDPDLDPSERWCGWLVAGIAIVVLVTHLLHALAILGCSTALERLYG